MSPLNLTYSTFNLEHGSADVTIHQYCICLVSSLLCLGPNLVCGLVEELFMRLDSAYLCVVVRLSVFVEGIL